MAKSKTNASAAEKFFIIGKYKSLLCTDCGTTVEHLDVETVTVICTKCCQKRLNPYSRFITDNIPDELLNTSFIKAADKKEKSDEYKPPRGWQFMAVYVSPEGYVYHKGEEQPELFNTLSPTEVKPKELTEKKPKLTSREKDELKTNIMSEITKLKEQLTESTLKKGDRKKIEKQISKEAKKLSKIK